MTALDLVIAVLFARHHPDETDALFRVVARLLPETADEAVDALAVLAYVERTFRQRHAGDDVIATGRI